MSGTTITRIINKVLEDDILPNDNQHWPLNNRKQSQSALGRLVTTSPPKRFKKQSIIIGSSTINNNYNNNTINSSSTMQGNDSPYTYADSPPWFSSNISSPIKNGKQPQPIQQPQQQQHYSPSGLSLTQSPNKKKHQQEEARITFNTTVTNTGGMVLEDVQFHSPVIEKKRGSLSLEGSSIDIAPPQKETISRRGLMHQQHANNQDSLRNSFDNSSMQADSISSSQVLRTTANSSNVFSPTKKDAISNMVQSQQDPSVKKITYDIVMPSMSFYQIENKEAFDQHYRSVSPTHAVVPNKSNQIRPPKYEAHLQSMDIRNDRTNSDFSLNNSLEIEKANIRSVNTSVVSSVANSQILSSPIHNPQTRLPNIHQKKDIVFDKHNNTLSLAIDHQHRTINSAILNTTLEREQYHHPSQPKPNTTPTISCTALSGFIFSKVHGVQNISPHSYSKRYNPTTHTPTAKKPHFHGNAKKPYNGLVEISSFAKTRKKPHVDPDSYNIVR